jgi:hypothetical protein
MVSPEIQHRVSRLRRDVDDVYELLDATKKGLEARLDRLEQTQQGMLDEHSAKLDVILAALHADRTVG